MLDLKSVELGSGPTPSYFFILGESPLKMFKYECQYHFTELLRGTNVYASAWHARVLLKIKSIPLTPAFCSLPNNLEMQWLDAAKNSPQPDMQQHSQNSFYSELQTNPKFDHMLRILVTVTFQISSVNIL